jgi:two-component system competent response regulator ComA
MVKILVFDDHLAVREGTKTILDSVEHFDVECFEPPYSAETIHKYDFSEVDVVLMDLNLGVDDINGIGVSKEILKNNEDVKVVLYTGYDVSDYWDEAIRIGIYGVVNKSESRDKIIDYIHHVLDGDIVVNFKDFQSCKIKSEEKESDESQSKDSLITEREKAILVEVEKGLTNQEIADKLHLSKRSIEYSLTSIYSKLKIGTRTEAVLFAKSEGIIE